MFWARQRSQLRMELAELKHKHDLKIQEMNASFERERKAFHDEMNFVKRQLVQEHELKLKEAVVLTKLDSEQRIKQAELEAERKINANIPMVPWMKTVINCVGIILVLLWLAQMLGVSGFHSIRLR